MPVVEYIVNYEYIATVLCENVDKPEMQCNGKCHVAKEFEQTLEHHSPVQLEKAVVLFDFIPVFSSYNTDCIAIERFSSKEKVPFFYSNIYTYLFSTNVLQPPIL